MHSVCPATTALPAAPSDQGSLTPRGAAFTIEALLGLGPASPDSSTPAGPDRGPSPCHERRRGADSARRHGEPRARRVRTIFTADQLERLEAEFERQQYMVGPERLYLAAALRSPRHSQGVFQTAHQVRNSTSTCSARARAASSRHRRSCDGARPLRSRDCT
ncbi:homeobox protein, putative [Ixodes scapularis]|uniref:Homeobox protein, putative n=1 Tax=Ixodes scapularis TaxID=6945 RepID=B7PPZ2_IXOSC|nr:homeobox protein, putative [Ixodes scapularis]|eukprot:XP_002435834.1 homeobox protein, putative [Ixodes scapularis]